MIYFVAKLISSLIITSQLMNFVIFLCRALYGCSISFLKKIRWVILKLHKTTCLGCCMIWLLRQSFDSSEVGLWVGSVICVPAAHSLCVLCGPLGCISSRISNWPLGKLDQINLPSLLLSLPQGPFLSAAALLSLQCNDICGVCVFTIWLF